MLEEMQARDAVIEAHGKARDAAIEADLKARGCDVSQNTFRFSLR
jgi:hypothetical protein